MPPTNESPACEAGPGKATTGRGNSIPAEFQAQRFPSDTRLCGLILDAEHLDAADSLAQSTKSESALAAISLWRKYLSRFPFLVVAGELHRPHGRIVGGLAGTWTDALALFGRAMARFHEIAEVSGVDFSSAWMPFLTDERQREVRSLIAEAQQCAGSA